MNDLYRGKYKISPDSRMIVYLINQIKHDYSPIVLICGKQRIGKSTFGLSLADILTWFFHNEEFNIEKYVFFDARKFLETGISVNKRVIIIDEASKDMSKSDWQTMFNKSMVKIIETQAYLNNIFIIILPHASRIASQYKIHIDLKIVMKKRGEAKIFYMKKNYGELSGEIKKISRQIFLGIEKLPLPRKNLFNKYNEYSIKRKRMIAQEELAGIEIKTKEWVCLACKTKNEFDDLICSRCHKNR